MQTRPQENTKKKPSSFKEWWVYVFDPEQCFHFCSSPSWNLHMYTRSNTAATLHYAITPTLWSVKERKPRSNSLRTPTAPSVLTQQPPPLWVQVCLRVWRMGGKRHFILHIHTQPHTHTHTHSHVYTHGGMLSPRHAAPPMYKPHTAAQRAGEQERRQDVQMETDGESEWERRREN